MVSAEHYDFLLRCSQPEGPTIQELVETLLASAITQEIEIMREIRKADAGEEPTLTIDADAKLRMDNDLPPWESPLVIEHRPLASSVPPAPPRPTH